MGRFLLLRLLVRRLLAAPLAVLLELNLPLDELLIFCRPVVYALARTAGQFDEAFLGHM